MPSGWWAVKAIHKVSGKAQFVSRAYPTMGGAVGARRPMVSQFPGYWIRAVELTQDEARSLAFPKMQKSTRGYNVTLAGEEIGEVYKNERRYNLRRLIVIRGWSATATNGGTLKSGPESRIFPTRREAVQVLRHHALREEPKDE